MIIKLATNDLRTRYGTFREALYYDGQKESIALNRKSRESSYHEGTGS